jgi:hypothetical protein
LLWERSIQSAIARRRQADLATTLEILLDAPVG